MNKDNANFYTRCYEEKLKEIDGVKFTPRELAVIAYLMNGMTSKETASFLDISIKTVDTFKRNIRNKAGLPSSSAVRGFIERSGKDDIFRDFYKHLRNQEKFQKCLKQLHRSISVMGVTCFVYPPSRRSLYHPFFKDMERDLKTAGLRLVKSVDGSTKRIDDNKKKVAIYFCEDDKREAIKQDILAHKTAWQNIILLTDGEGVAEELTADLKHVTVLPFKLDEYYPSFLDLLKKITPSRNIEKICAFFEGSYQKNFYRIIFEKYDFLKFSGSQKKQRKAKGQNIISKNLGYVGVYILLVGTVTLVNLFFLNYDKTVNGKASVEKDENGWFQDGKDSEGPIVDYMPELLTSHEELVNRTDVLKEIRNRFKSSNVVVLTARSGMGKTLCAAQYAKQWRREMIVRFISADTSSKVDQSYREIAYELGINGTSLTKGVLMQLVHKKLANSKKEFLFIFDNVDSYDDLRDYLSNLPQNIKVIITTRQPSLVPDGSIIKLTEFSLDYSKEYIKKCLAKRNLSAESIHEIIKEIGTLPYDLKYVVSYIIEHPFVDLKDATKKVSNKIKDKLFEQLAGNTESEKMLAWEVLQCLAYLDPDYVPIEILRRFFPKDADLLSDTIKRLENLSLLQIVLDKRENKGIRVHRNLQEEIKNAAGHKSKSRQKEKLQRSLLKVLNDAFPLASHRPGEGWRTAEVLYAHVKKVMAEVSDSPNGAEKNVASLYYKMSKFYSCVNIDRLKALEAALEALNRMKRLYPSHHPFVADALDNLGVAYIYANNKYIAKGIEYLRKSLDMKKKLYAQNHPSIAETLRNMGLAYRRRGDFKESLTYAQHCLGMRRSLSRGDSIELAEALNDVAWVYYELNENEQAKDYIRKSLDMYGSLLPKEKPSAVYALHTYGALLLKLGEIDESIDTLRETMEISDRFAMRNHGVTSLAWHDLGEGYFRKKDFQKALECYFKSLDIKKELCAVNGHPNRISESLDAIGDIYRELGDFDNAQVYYEQSLEYRVKLCPQDKDKIKINKRKIKGVKKIKNNHIRHLFGRALNMLRGV